MREKLCQTLSYLKSAHKMLVKLTPAGSFNGNAGDPFAQSIFDDPDCILATFQQ
jgi:hypothetical protein